MYTEAKMMFMICESPLHAGCGSDLDFIDNPIQRERHTGYPKIESSSLKGAMRERFSELLGRQNPDIAIAFGPEEPSAGNERQGSLTFTDARLLLFPVKSMKGVFAWITCPAVLERFKKDMGRLHAGSSFTFDVVPTINPGTVLPFDEELLIQQENDYLCFLEDSIFEAYPPGDIDIKMQGESLQNWLAQHLFPGKENAYWQEALTKKLLIVSDDDFAYFVEFTTEVITRNKIDPEKGVVKDGHLFTEEYLPVDSVLYSLVMAHSEFNPIAAQRKEADQVMKIFADNLSGKINNMLQVGGNATIGKGLMRTVILNHSSVAKPEVK